MDYRDESEAGESLLPNEVSEIRREAEKSYRGPRWIQFAVICTLLFSAGSIALGIGKPKQSVEPKPPEPHITSPSSPTIETGNLPITLSAHFGMSSIDEIPSHLSISNHALYLSTLNQPVNTWPTITVSNIQYSDSGEALRKAMHAVGKVELVPPISSGSKGKTDSVTWAVRDWRTWAMGDWIVAAVDWSASEHNVADQVQLYSLYIPTHKYGMFQSLTWKTKADPYQITAGGGHVVIVSGSSAVSQPIKQSTASSAGNATPSTSGSTTTNAIKVTRTPLPDQVTVETLGGDDPLDPVKKTTVLQHRAPMEDILLHNQVLYYASPSKAAQAFGANVEWFRQPLDGSSKPIGVFETDSGATPVVGTTGNLYVVQAVPSAGPDAGHVVRMSPAIQIANDTNESFALPSMVKFWQATDGTLVWTQQVDQQWTLVLGTVN